MADAKKVKIGGIWYNVKDETARNGLSNKQDTLTFDTTPTANSTNPVTSGGVKTALDAKQNMLADSGWLSLTNASVFDGSIAYRKIGKFVYVSGQSVKLKNALTSGSISLGVIPDGYRPGKWSAFWAGRPGDAGYEAGMIVVATSGDIAFHKPASISQWNAGAAFFFSFMYMTN